MHGKQYRLRVRGELEQVQIACDFISDVAREAGLDDEAIYQCQLSIEEICTNIVEHGYHYNGSDKSIEINCEHRGDMLRICILDDAPHFNPLLLPDPDPQTPLWERSTGGWGVFFVRQYMDSVSYRLENNRNCLVLEKRILK